MSSAPIADRQSKRRRILTISGLIALFGLVYAVVIALYANSGAVELSVPADDPEPGAVQLLLTAVEVNAGGNQISFGLEVLDGGRAEDETQRPAPGLTVLAEPLAVLIPSAAGERMVEFHADEILAERAVRLEATGDIEYWPFDRYVVESPIVPYLSDQPGERIPAPVALYVAGHVPGWDIRAESTIVDTVHVGDRTVPVQQLQITATRSGATVAFGIVLLCLMLVLPALALATSLAVIRRRRAVEATMLGWIAAMLFATVPLRTFLPGSPPIGSWVDYVVVLWVLIGVVAGHVVYGIAWLRYGPPGEASGPKQPPRPDDPSRRSAPGVPVEEGEDLGVVDAGEISPGKR